MKETKVTITQEGEHMVARVLMDDQEVLSRSVAMTRTDPRELVLMHLVTELAPRVPINEDEDEEENVGDVVCSCGHMASVHYSSGWGCVACVCTRTPSRIHESRREFHHLSGTDTSQKKTEKWDSWEQRANHLIDRYQKRLAEYPSQQMDTSVIGDQHFGTGIVPLRHANWLLGQMNVLIEEHRKSKFNRRLRFVQGILCSFGIYSIDEMQEHNRRTK